MYRFLGSPIMGVPINYLKRIISFRDLCFSHPIVGVPTIFEIGFFSLWLYFRSSDSGCPNKVFKSVFSRFVCQWEGRNERFLLASCINEKKAVMSGFYSLHASMRKDRDERILLASCINEKKKGHDEQILLALCINEKAVMSRFYSLYVSMKRPWWADFTRFMYQWKGRDERFI